MVALVSGGEHSGGSNPDVLSVEEFPPLLAAVVGVDSVGVGGVPVGDSVAGKVPVTVSGNILVGDSLGSADSAVSKALARDSNSVLVEADLGVVSGSSKAPVQALGKAPAGAVLGSSISGVKVALVETQGKAQVKVASVAAVSGSGKAVPVSLMLIVNGNHCFLVNRFLFILRRRKMASSLFNLLEK